MKFTFVAAVKSLRYALLYLGLTSAALAATPGEWPRQISDSRSAQTLEQPPERIVSTSVTLTGSLLAIGAPVVASGATTPGNRFADSQGFLRQWGEVAKARNVQRLYIGEPNAEAVAAQMPDLILISATGGDSALSLYDQLSTIAPTIVVNYDDKSWQALLTTLGEITGHEKQAAERIASFNAELAKTKAAITLPPQPVSALVYNTPARTANLWTPESAQGQLLKELGFTLATPPAQMQTSQSQGQRHDIVQLGGETLAAGLNGQSILLFANDQRDADALRNNALLTHIPAVENNQVWPLGTETFRLDYYSVSHLLALLNKQFKS